MFETKSTVLYSAHTVYNAADGHRKRFDSGEGEAMHRPASPDIDGKVFWIALTISVAFVL
jgi:hypothetical protein